MKAWAIPVCLVFAAVALLCGALFMPTAELLPATVESGSWMPGLSPVRSYDAMMGFKKIGDQLTEAVFKIPGVESAMKDPIKGSEDSLPIPGRVRSYVLYAIFMAGAMICAAVALNAVGRWDSEEKTIIPYKK
jgi:hypothetical protein